MPTPETDPPAWPARPIRRRAGGSFLPDVATIERLANAIFKGRDGRRAAASRRSRLGACAVVAAVAADGGAIGQAVPVQPPFGVIDPPASSLPASAPARSFGGASAGSAAPATTQAGHVGPPAAGQTLVTRPRVDPTRPRSTCRSAQRSASPFAAEIDSPRRAGDVAGRPSRPSPAVAARIRRAAARLERGEIAGGGARPPAADLPDVAATPAAPTALAPAPQAIAPKLADVVAGPRVFDAALFRNDFPDLAGEDPRSPLIWLDNGATTQKPQAVIDRLAFYYAHENSNVHRGAHTLAARSTDAYEAARDKARRFVNASSTKEIVFVRGATEGINLVAQSWGRRNVREGDEIVVTWLEHHANIVPWQQLCHDRGQAPGRAGRRPRRRQARRIREAAGAAHPHRRADLVSNALGTVTPAAEMIAMAHRHGALALVDGAHRSRIGAPTCRRSTPTSSSSPATRCSRRPASASSTASRRSST